MNDTHLGAELLELLGELRPRHLEWRDCKVRAVLAPSQKVALGHSVVEEHGRVFGAYGTAVRGRVGVSGEGQSTAGCSVPMSVPRWSTA